MERDLSVDQLAEALTVARQPQLTRLAEAMLEEGFLGVVGEGQVGKTLLCRQVAGLIDLSQTAKVVVVDLVGAYSIAKVVARWRQQLLIATIGPVALSEASWLNRDFWPEATERAMLHAREMFGDQLTAALTDQPTKSDKPRDYGGPLELTKRLVAESDVPCVLMFDHLQAPLLTRRHPIDPADLLWQVRSVAQHIPKLHVVVACTPGSEYLAADPDAAFYGDGTWMSIDAPSFEQWQQAADECRTSIDLEWWHASQGHVPTLLEMLRQRDGATRGWREAFESVASHQAEHLNRCLLHASSLHRLGAHVLSSIADGDGPYAATPEARSDEIAAAVSQLRLAGLIKRDPHDNRGWQLVNPTVSWLLAGANRNPTSTGARSLQRAPDHQTLRFNA